MATREACEGTGKRAISPDYATKTGVCPVCNGIRAAELPPEGNYVMDYHTVLVIDWDDEPEEED